MLKQKMGNRKINFSIFYLISSFSISDYSNYSNILPILSRFIQINNDSPVEDLIISYWQFSFNNESWGI